MIWINYVLTFSDYIPTQKCIMNIDQFTWKLRIRLDYNEFTFSGVMWKRN